LIRERVIAGVRRAQAQGKHCGRRPVKIDLRPAVAMLDKGHGIKTTARSLGVSVSTPS
jgi:DNA invertase Pin-like site-specific DNA recombinase